MDAEEQQGNSKPWLKEHSFKPGQSGNPGGRPKGRTLTALLRRRLDEIDEKTGKPVAETAVDAWVAAIQDGNVAALKEALDRTEGKVPDKIKASVGGASATDQMVAVMLRVLQAYPEARVAVAKELESIAHDTARTSDGAGPGDPDGDAGPGPGPVAG